jgi:hypothetical protein
VTGVVALYRGERVVNVCCGGHRPAAGCLCCLECPAGAASADPTLLALLAHGAREHQAALRMAYRRAEHAVGLDGYWDLFRATAHAVRVVTPCFPHLEGSVA